MQTRGRWRIVWVVAIGLAAGSIGWQCAVNRIQQATFGRLNPGLYHAMVFTEHYGQRSYQPNGRYYYTNLYDPRNFSMVRSNLIHYLRKHDPSAALKIVGFRMPDSHNLIGLATVVVPVFPGISTNVKLNDAIPLFHFSSARP